MDILSVMISILALLLSGIALVLERRASKRNRSRDDRLAALEEERHEAESIRQGWGWVSPALVPADGKWWWRLENVGNGRVFGFEFGARVTDESDPDHHQFEDRPNEEGLFESWQVPAVLGAGELVYVRALVEEPTHYDVMVRWDDIAGKETGHQRKTVFRRVAPEPFR